MPFMPEGITPEPNVEYNGPLNGCADFWPNTTSYEWFETAFKKTPVAPVESIALTEDPELPPNQLRLF
jgi:hypothetical protein